MRTRLITSYCFLIAAFSACAAPLPADGSLPFTTMEQKSDAAFAAQQVYGALEPGLMVFADAAEADEGGVWFSEAAREGLRGVNWRTHFVIAAFQGWRAGEGYGIVVERVMLEGEVVRVYAALMAGEGGGAVTSPYHLLEVRRPGEVGRLSFELVVEGEVAAGYPPP